MKIILIFLITLSLLFLTSCIADPAAPETMEIFNRWEVTSGTFQMIGGIIIIVVSAIMFGLTKWWDGKKGKEKGKKRIK